MRRREEEEEDWKCLCMKPEAIFDSTLYELNYESTHERIANTSYNM